MEGKYICTVDELYKQRKKTQFKENVKRKANDVVNWIGRNKELILFFAPTAIGVVTSGMRLAKYNSRVNKEKELKDLYCYDRSLGHYWKLRRKLTNKDWVEIDKRRNNGERLSDILNELKVLK